MQIAKNKFDIALASASGGILGYTEGILWLNIEIIKS